MNNQLIKITEQNGKKAVSARELHQFLGSKRQFQNWIKERIEKYQFVENQDFEVFNDFVKNPNGGRPLIEYALSIDMAKELAMIENNEQGRMARKYFIECERQLAQTKIPSYQIDDRIKRAEAWIEEEKERQRLELENKELSEDLDESQKKVGYLRNEVANRKEMMKEQHQQILDLESRNIRLNRQKMRLEDKIATDSDKVKYYDHCHENGDKTLTNFTETAGLLGQKRTLLIDVLLFNGYLYRNRFGKLRAYAKYMDRYFVLKDGNENEYGYVPKNVYVTIEGRKFILENFRRLYKKYNNHINSVK